MRKKDSKKGSIFFKIFFGVLTITFLSNLVFAYVIYSGYEDAISPLRKLVSPEEFRNTEISINATWIISASSLIFIIVIVILFAVMFTSKIVKPIEVLVNAIRKVGQGNLGIKVKPEGNDEVAELSREFNHMIEQLKQTQHQLEEEKQVLEVKVRARTRELKELADGLDEKVKERTKELQNRVEELEQFHRLTVGRELKMTQLKEKIHKLEEQLKNYKK